MLAQNSLGIEVTQWCWFGSVPFRCNATVWCGCVPFGWVFFSVCSSCFCYESGRKTKWEWGKNHDAAVSDDGG